MTPGAEQIVAAIRRWQAERIASVRQAGAVARAGYAKPTEPLVVAIDGHGAAGKTTITAEVADALGAPVLHGDDHLHEARAGDDPRPMAQYYDWAALRRRVRAATAPLLLVEGVSAAAPALADLITHTVFVATAEAVRLERLHARVSDEEWDEDWLTAERAYFASRPPASFDLVVPGSSGSPAA